MRLLNRTIHNMIFGTYSDHHRNWILTIAYIKLPVVFLGSCAIALIVTLLTFLFDPIYEAKTLITLDANLSNTLKNIDISYPSVTATDYIRYEFFATHSVTLMHTPKLADQFVNSRSIKDRSGRILFPEYFIKPSLFRLVFSNNGQGIKAQWVSDTQQFIISGYSKNPDEAVEYSKDYTEAFLKESADNVKGALEIIVERLEGQISEISGKLESVDARIQQVKKSYHIDDLDVENERLINRIYSIKLDLNSAHLDEKAYKLRIDHLYREAANHEALKKYQITMESNPMISTLKGKIQELTRTLVGHSVELTKEHPEYKVTEKTLEITKQALRNEVEKTFYQQIDRRSDFFETVLQSMLDYDLNHIIHSCRIEHYNSLLELYQKRLEELIVTRSELNKLTDQRTQLTTLITATKTNHINVSNIQKKTVPFFRVVSPAIINKDNLKYYKYFPKRKLALALTFLGSLLVLSFLVIAKELFANTLYSGWQLSALKRSVDYAVIPLLDTTAANTKHDFDAIICKQIHEFCLSTNDTQIVRITSHAEGEGKATIARVMASYYYKMGKSVVLVDGDLKNGSLTNWFGLNDRAGLMDYIGGLKESADIVIRDQIPNMSFIAVGNQNTLNPKQFVLTPLLNLFSILVSDYEKIIYVDEPICCKHFMLADMLPPHDIVIVLQSGKHSLYEVDSLIGMPEFTKGKANLKGIIINKNIII